MQDALRDCGIQHSPATDHYLTNNENAVTTSVLTNHAKEIVLYVDSEERGDLMQTAFGETLRSTPPKHKQQEQLESQETFVDTILQGDHNKEHACIQDVGSTPLPGFDSSNDLFASLRDSRPVSDDGQSDLSRQDLADSPDFLERETDSFESDVDLVNDTEVDRSIEEWNIANVGESVVIPGEFAVGNAFDSLEEVEDALHLYEETHEVKLYKRDVRTLDALLKRSLKLQRLPMINESLKYGQLLYCCVYGGKRRAQKLATVDEHGVARFTDCKMFVRFVISDDGRRLVVNGCLQEHNHEEVAVTSLRNEPPYSNTGNAPEICLGAGFVDLQELYRAIHKYETEHHIHLWRRDGRTVESLAKRAPGTARKIMETNPSLRFAELRFCCSFGGRNENREKSATGCGGVATSAVQGCEMHIRFGISEDGSQLVVKSMSEDHNHDVYEDMGIRETLHPDLCSYIAKMVWSDVNISLEEVRNRLEEYVYVTMFKDSEPPPRSRRQYFPLDKQLRYFMTKAVKSLSISQQAEDKLEAHVKRLQEAHVDEKMIFNFKVRAVQNGPLPPELMIGNEGTSLVDADGNFLSPTTNDGVVLGHKPVVPDFINNVEGVKVLFCHQTPHQQRMMKRYCSQVILTRINHTHSKIPFPLFALYVQTNVDYQIVASFILQVNTVALIVEALQTVKEWNPGWSPKFFVCDYSPEQIAAVENVFPNTFVLISDMSREKAWSEWLCGEENGLVEHKNDVTAYLEAIAHAYSEDMLNTAARELEDSEVWHLSDKLRNWFQLEWLSQAKRWIVGYRPDDFLVCQHQERTLESELRMFNGMNVLKMMPLQEVIQRIVEHVAPVACSQYHLLNRNSMKLQKQLRYMYSDIPKYLTCRPGEVTQHIYERLTITEGKGFALSCLHPGIFSVRETSGEDTALHTVSFGDSNSFPSCDCIDWHTYKLPCVHLCAVFNNYPEWNWGMLTVAYTSSPILSIDWSVLEIPVDEPEQNLDKATQTLRSTMNGSGSKRSASSLATDKNSVHAFTETPEVLVAHCRSLLNQLSKHHPNDEALQNLLRMRSELQGLVGSVSDTSNVDFSCSRSIPDQSLNRDLYMSNCQRPGRPAKSTPPGVQSRSGVLNIVSVSAGSTGTTSNLTFIQPRPQTYVVGNGSSSNINSRNNNCSYVMDKSNSKNNRNSSNNNSTPNSGQLQLQPLQVLGRQHKNLTTVFLVNSNKVLVNANNGANTHQTNTNTCNNQKTLLTHKIITQTELEALLSKSKQPAVKPGQKMMVAIVPAVEKRMLSPSDYLVPPEKRSKPESGGTSAEQISTSFNLSDKVSTIEGERGTRSYRSTNKNDDDNTKHSDDIKCSSKNSNNISNSNRNDCNNDNINNSLTGNDNNNVDGSNNNNDNNHNLRNNNNDNDLIDYSNDDCWQDDDNLLTVDEDAALMPDTDAHILDTDVDLDDADDNLNGGGDVITDNLVINECACGEGEPVETTPETCASVLSSSCGFDELDSCEAMATRPRKDERNKVRISSEDILQDKSGLFGHR